MPRYDLPRAAEGPLRLVQLFVNTIDREHGREWLPTPVALGAWLGEQGLEPGGEAGQGHLDRALELREALRALLRANAGGAADPAARATLNEAARRGGVVPVVGGDGRPQLQASAGGVDGALGAVVAVALEGMLDGTWSRLKVCRQCSWAFWDGSRNRSGSWCSMQLCGNRTKTRAYRRRRNAVDGGRA